MKSHFMITRIDSITHHLSANIYQSEAHKCLFHVQIHLSLTNNELLKLAFIEFRTCS